MENDWLFDIRGFLVCQSSETADSFRLKKLRERPITAQDH
jgi:hypothetical protein